MRARSSVVRAGAALVGAGALMLGVGLGPTASAATTYAPGAPCQVVSAAQLSGILGHGRPQATAQGHDCAWSFADGSILRSEYLPVSAGIPVADVGAPGVRIVPEPDFAPGAFLEVHTHATYLAYPRRSGGWMELAWDHHSPHEVLAVARIVHYHAP